MLNRLMIVLLLAGCTTETVVNKMADDIKDELRLIADDVYSLPPECGDQTKLAQRIELTRDRVDILEETYIKEADDLRTKNRRLEGYIFTLSVALVVAAGLAVRRLLSRVSA